MTDEVEQLKLELETLRNAVRKHRDCKGHDRCWMDDLELYQALPETTTIDLGLPPREEFMAECKKYCEAYWENRQCNV